LKNLDVVEISKKKRHVYLLEKLQQKKTLTAAETKELEKYEMAQKNKDTEKTPETFKTRRAAAAYLKVSERTISNYLNNDPDEILKNKQGHFIRRSLDLFKRNNGTATGPKHRGLAADADIKETKNELIRMDLAARKGKLVLREEVEKASIAKIIMVKRILLNMSKRLPPLLKGKSQRKIQEIIRKEVNHTINIFAKDYEKKGGSSET
jgi:hypothetical protein